MSLFGKNLLIGDEWALSELKDVLNLALSMKVERHQGHFKQLLKNKTFAMLFYNSSLRTRLSFGAAISELGGFPEYLTPEMTWLAADDNIGESVKDAARVISRYAAGIGIRMTLDKVKYIGYGDEYLRDFAKWSDIPIINMGGDLYHPCQGLSDLMGWSEWQAKNGQKDYIDNLRGKTLLLTWGHSPFTRPWGSVQSHLLLAAKFGMNIRLARPSGYDLGEMTYKSVKAYCLENNTQFDILDDHNAGYENTDIVYVRNWYTKNAYQNGVLSPQEQTLSLAHNQWIVTAEKMARTNNAAFANPMPVIRGYEATDEVVDGPNSIIYNVAENRLHIQKAILTLILGNN